MKDDTHKTSQKEKTRKGRKGEKKKEGLCELRATLTCGMIPGDLGNI